MKSISFCKSKPDELIVASSIKVNMFNINRNLFEDEIKSSNELTSFKNIVTCSQYREDGQILVAGQKTGEIHVY